MYTCPYSRHRLKIMGSAGDDHAPHVTLTRHDMKLDKATSWMKDAAGADAKWMRLAVQLVDHLDQPVTAGGEMHVVAVKRALGC